MSVPVKGVLRDFGEWTARWRFSSLPRSDMDGRETTFDYLLTIRIFIAVHAPRNQIVAITTDS